MKSAASFGRPLLGAALILAVSGALAWAAPEHISDELKQRLMAALLGAVVVIYANAIPKSLTALAQLRCSPEREQAARRFAGWSLVLGGINYMLAALFAPLGEMHLVGGSLLGVALLAAILRCYGVGSPAARG